MQHTLLGWDFREIRLSVFLSCIKETTGRQPARRGGDVRRWTGISPRHRERTACEKVGRAFAVTTVGSHALQIVGNADLRSLPAFRRRELNFLIRVRSTSAYLCREIAATPLSLDAESEYHAQNRWHRRDIPSDQPTNFVLSGGLK